MIQFNLLPQVKVDYIKTKRLKRTIIGISILAIIASVILLVVTFSLKSFQSRHLTNLDKNIAELTAELEATPELNKIISVQNQLNTLPTLYDGRPAVKRLPGYLDQTTPTNVGLTEVGVDFSTNFIEVSGMAENLEAVNRYLDTLKFTGYKIEGSEDTLPAFKDVVVTSFGRSDENASFTATFTFDPVIFNGAQNVSLVIPSIVTTRSQVQNGASLLDGGIN